MDGTSNAQICLGKPSENGTHNCKGLQQARETVHRVEPAGVWESTSTLSVVGIRKHTQSPTPSDSESPVEDEHYTAEPSALASALKHRATKDNEKEGHTTNATSLLRRSLDLAFNHSRRRNSSDPTESLLLHDADGWEAWTLSATGEFLSRPLFIDAPDDIAGSAEDFALEQQQLFVAAAGPITRLGNKSVAVGFGNTVKIISLGRESSFEVGGMGGSPRSEGPPVGGVIGVGVGSYKWRARRAGRKIS
jgi:hypothetical protein